MADTEQRVFAPGCQGGFLKKGEGTRTPGRQAFERLGSSGVTHAIMVHGATVDGHEMRLSVERKLLTRSRSAMDRRLANGRQALQNAVMMQSGDPANGAIGEPRTGEANLDVIIPARDEELNIRHALESVVGWARRVFVVDSGSKDRTVPIARALGAEVVEKEWLGHAQQKNWALDNLPLKADWTLFLDADERVLPDLRRAIDDVSRQPTSHVNEAGFFVNRYFIFLGRRIRHCGYYPSYNLRFIKRGRGRYEERDVHEHMIVDGPVGYLAGHLEHHDRRGLEVYMNKHNRYSTLEAREIFEMLQGSRRDRIRPSLLGDPLERRRWIKEVVYPHLPAKWLFRFVFMYLVRGGFLDGRTGLNFSLFMSAYELLIALKLKELEAANRSSLDVPVSADATVSK